MLPPPPNRFPPITLAAGIVAVIGALWLLAAPQAPGRPIAAAPAARIAQILQFKIAVPLVMKSALVEDLPPAPTPRSPTLLPPSLTSTPESTTPAPTMRPSTTPTFTAMPATNTAAPTIEPPTATETPTEMPTLEPTPTTKPTVAADCHDIAINGSFEGGATGWGLFTNAGARYNRLSRVIREPATGAMGELVQPHGGTWVGQLGGGTGGWTDELTNPDPGSTRGFLLPLAADMISATLKFHFAIDTQETRNVIPDDRFQMTLVNEDQSDQIQVLDTPLSEETQLPGQWKEYKIDMTKPLTQRRRWDRARLRLKSENGQNFATWHTVDDLSIVVCVVPKADAWARLPLSWEQRGR